MGFHPSSGVPAAVANNAFQPANTSACDKYYPTDPCLVVIDIDAFNALISEVRRVIDSVQGYDCNETDNLLTALPKIICQYVFSLADGDPPAVNPTTVSVQVTNPDGSVTTCETVTTDPPCPGFYIDRETGCTYVYDTDNLEWYMIGGAILHIGPCSDAAAKLIPDCAKMWFQEDVGAWAVRYGNYWVEAAP